MKPYENPVAQSLHADNQNVETRERCYLSEDERGDLKPY